MPLPWLLVIDSRVPVAAVRAALRGRAHVEGVESLQEGLALLRSRSWSAVVLSLETPAVDLEVARRIQESGHAGALVLVTAQPTVDLMLSTARLGVMGVLPAPLDAEELWATLRDVVAPAEEMVPLEPALGEEALIGRSPAILEVFRMVARIARSSATVLVTGESGTGKELVARAIHGASDRAQGPFVAINCAAIPENLLESELFGHEKGAFTGAITRKVGRFERADRGTLLLDEIGDMSLALQAKILRALQEREIERVGGEERIRVDVRVVAATNKDLHAAIEEGSFREDLYFRLAVVTLQLPRLVHRGSDLDLLAQHFAARFSAQYGRGLQGVARSVFHLLHQHSWPGNVRELRNVMERAVLMAHGPVLRPEHLPLEPGTSPVRSSDALATLPGYSPDLPLAEVERLHIREVLHRVGGHMGRASEVLGVHRNTLTRKVREYQLEDAVR